MQQEMQGFAQRVHGGEGIADLHAASMEVTLPVRPAALDERASISDAEALISLNLPTIVDAMSNPPPES
ncbi:hypothetical protein [Variovorax sp. RA8]|uniref:hypothetical protein n=1 Tax=Variovorax sp. (strain JCM 16519 / RA8) TaxID=662548 RepID=UPI0013A52BA7|nr:hypothetical protein [Variovorax sp. RA8]